MAYDITIGDRSFDFATIQGFKDLRDYAEDISGYRELKKLMASNASDSSYRLAEDVADLLDSGFLSSQNPIHSTLMSLYQNLGKVKTDVSVTISDGLKPGDSEPDNWVVTPDEWD